MGKITIESASANGKDRRTQVISSDFYLWSSYFVSELRLTSVLAPNVLLM